MALSDWDKAIYGYIVGKVAPKGTTRYAMKLAVGAALIAAQAAGRLVGPAAVRAAPYAGRALVNPYVGIPLGAAAGTYALQQYAEESGLQEQQNVAVAEAYDYLTTNIPVKGSKRQKQISSVYNKAMKKAIKAVKDSAYQGKKGVLTNAKRTFGTVAKTVSKIKQGKKVSSRGVSGVIKRSTSNMFLAKRKTKKRGKLDVGLPRYGRKGR